MFNPRFSVLFIAVALALKASSLTTDLYIVNAEIAPDGFTKTATLANGTFPGPILSANVNERFEINVIDQLYDTSMKIDTTVHWHGLFQPHTAWADGTASVTQCPIIPGNSFLYNFTAPGQSGTYWYHSHYSLQYCDGLRGPLIIYDPDDPLLDMYDIDDASTVITLADWYHVPAANLTGPGEAAATLINGLGRWSGNLTAPLAVVNVTQGQRYRFRLISTSCEPAYNFWIDGHNMTVIEADGVETEPLLVDSIEIYTAQRYSFILTADQPIGNYWIRSQPNEGNTTFIGGMNSAILRYSGAPDEEPTDTDTVSVIPLLESNLHPLIPNPPPLTVNQAFNFNFTFNGTDYLVNGYPFFGAPVPILLQILNGQYNAFDLLPLGSVYGIQPNNTIEISMPGGALNGPHPMHLHGHNFWVIKSAGNDTPNYINPVIRDTVSIGNSSDNVTIRFQTNNPGPWFFHCHIDFHLNLGFAVAFAEDAPAIPASVPVPPSWDELCPIYSNQTGPSKFRYV